MTNPRSLHLFLSVGTTARLLEYAHQLQTIDAHLAACLDREASAHVRVAHLGNGRLLLHADSTAWSTRLRYLVPQLLRCLRQNTVLADLQHIEVRVTPSAQPATPVTRPVVLSADNAAILDSTANSISDPALRAALKRLARRGRTKPDV